MSAGVILLAAGSGRRFGGRISKQFLELDKVPLFLHSFRAFVQSPCVQFIVVAVSADKTSSVKRILSKEKTAKKIYVVEGGRFRGESVKRGLQGFPECPRVVLVHDAARPLVTPKIIEAVYKATLKHDVALAAWPLSDTLKLGSKKSMVKKTIPRENLWLAQTPQGFSRRAAQQCLMNPSKTATDDVALAERKGFKVALVTASSTNIKITYPTDLKIASALLHS